jgi:uncharacterized caspase-like protein
LKALAVLYQSSGKHAQAEETLRKLSVRDERDYGKESAPVASDLESLAKVLISEHKNTEAASLLTRAHQIKAGLPGASSLPTETADTAGLNGAANQTPVKDKWALVVGISNFKDPAINLRFAAKDATDFRNYLINEAHFQPDHVKLLTDASATRENIIGSLGDHWLKKLVQCDDLVVLFISSHGSAAKPEAGETNFIVPYEGNMDNLVFSGIPMQWLTVGLKDLVHCQRLVLLLDVCHGGAAAAELNAKQSAVRTGTSSEAKEILEKDSKGITRARDFDTSKISVGEGQIIVASSLANQLSWESKNYQNGVFTRRLIEGLKQHADKTTVDDAYKYMKEKVEEEVLRDRAEVQTPVLVRHWQGDDVALGTIPIHPRPGLQEATARAPSPAPNGAKSLPNSGSRSVKQIRNR